MKLKHGGIYRKKGMGRLLAICVSSFYRIGDEYPLRLMWLSGTMDQQAGPVLLNEDANYSNYEYLGMIDWADLEARVGLAYENIEAEKDNET